MIRYVSPPDEHPWFDWRHSDKNGSAATGRFSDRFTHRRQAAASKPISASLSPLAKPAKGPLVPLQHAVPITMVGAITERVLTDSRSLHEKSDLVLVGHADATMHLNTLTRHQIVSIV